MLSIRHSLAATVLLHVALCILLLNSTPSDQLPTWACEQSPVPPHAAISLWLRRQGSPPFPGGFLEELYLERLQC